MCRCTPEIRTPWCGKPGCETPAQQKAPDVISIGGTNAVELAPAGKIALDAITITFPPGYWDQPSHAIVLNDGRTLVEHRIDGLALIIAGGLRKLLERRPTYDGLVDSSGRALVAPSAPATADTLDRQG